MITFANKIQNKKRRRKNFVFIIMEADNSNLRAKAFVRLLLGQHIKRLLKSLEYHIENKGPNLPGTIRRKGDEAAWSAAVNIVAKKFTTIIKDIEDRRKTENIVLVHALSPFQWKQRYPSIEEYCKKSNALLDDDVTPLGKTFFFIYYYVQYLDALINLAWNLKNNLYSKMVTAYNSAIFGFIKDVADSNSNGLDGVYLTKKGKIVNRKNEWFNTFSSRLSKKLGMSHVLDITFPLPPEFFGTLIGDNTKNIEIDLSLWWPKITTQLFRCLPNCELVTFIGRHSREKTRIFRPPTLGKSVKKLVLSGVILDNKLVHRGRYEHLEIQQELKWLKLNRCSMMAPKADAVSWIMKYRPQNQWEQLISGLELSDNYMEGDVITAFVRATVPNCERLSLQNMLPPTRMRIVNEMRYEELPLDMIEEEDVVYAGLPLSLRFLSLTNMLSTNFGEYYKIQFDENDLRQLFNNMPGLEVLERLYIKGGRMNIQTLDHKSLVGLMRLKKLHLEELELLECIKPDTLQYLRNLEDIVIKGCRNIDIDISEYAKKFEETGFFLSTKKNNREYNITIENSGTAIWQREVDSHQKKRKVKFAQMKKRAKIEKEKKQTATEGKKKKKKRKRRLVLRGRVKGPNADDEKNNKLEQSEYMIRQKCRVELPNPFHLMANIGKLPRLVLNWTQLRNWASITYVHPKGRGRFFVDNNEENVIFLGVERSPNPPDVILNIPGNHEEMYVQTMKLVHTNFDKKHMASLVEGFGWSRQDKLIPVFYDFGEDFGSGILNVISLGRSLHINIGNSENSHVNSDMELVRIEGIFKDTKIVAGKFKLDKEKKTLEFSITLTQLMLVLGAQVLSCMLSADEDGYATNEWESEHLELPDYLFNLKRLVYTIISNYEKRDREPKATLFVKTAMDNDLVIMWQIITSVSFFLEYAKGSDDIKNVDRESLRKIKYEFRMIMNYMNNSPANPDFDGYKVATDDAVIPPDTVVVPMPTDTEKSEVGAFLSRILRNKAAKHESQKASANKIVSLTDLLKSKGVSSWDRKAHEMKKFFDTEAPLDDESVGESSGGESEKSQDNFVIQEQPITNETALKLKKRRGLEQENAILRNLQKIADKVDDGKLDFTEANSTKKLLLQSLPAATSILDLSININNLSEDNIQTTMHSAIRAKQMLDDNIKVAEIIIEGIVDYEEETAMDGLLKSIMEVKRYIQGYEGIVDAISLQEEGWKKMDLTDAAICTVCEKITSMQCPECKFAYCSEECMDLDYSFHSNYLKCQAASAEIGGEKKS